MVFNSVDTYWLLVIHWCIDLISPSISSESHSGLNTNVIWENFGNYSVDGSRITTAGKILVFDFQVGALANYLTFVDITDNKN